MYILDKILGDNLEEFNKYKRFFITRLTEKDRNYSNDEYVKAIEHEINNFYNRDKIVITVEEEKTFDALFIPSLAMIIAIVALIFAIIFSICDSTDKVLLFIILIFLLLLSIAVLFWPRYRAKIMREVLLEEKAIISADEFYKEMLKFY